MEETNSIVAQEIANRKSYCHELHTRLNHLRGDDVDMYTLTRIMTLQRRIATIDAWITSLPAEEAFVLRELLAFGRSRSFVQHHFARTFGLEIDDDRLYMYLAKALRGIALLIDEEFDCVADLLSYIDYGK